MGLSQGGEREREEGRRERKREERSRRGRGSRRSRNMEKDGVGGQHSIFRVQGAWHSHFEDTLKSLSSHLLKSRSLLLLQHRDFQQCPCDCSGFILSYLQINKTAATVIVVVTDCDKELVYVDWISEKILYHLSSSIFPNIPLFCKLGDTS